MTVLEGQSRSEPRPGSARRWLAFGCGGFALLVFALFAGYLWWANTPPPPEPAPVVALPSPNGFDACVAAATKLPGLATGTPKPSPVDDPMQTDPAALREALKADEPALNELRRALRLEYVTPPVTSMRQEFPYLAQYRQAARRFSAESRVAQSEGRWGVAIDRALDPIDLGSRTGRGGTLIHHLVGLALAAIGTVQAERCVAHLSVAEAHAAGQRLDRVMVRFPTAVDALRDERRFGLSAARELFSGQMDLSQLNLPAPTGFRGGPNLLVLYPKPWAYASVKTGYDNVIRELEKPYPQRQPVPDPSEPMAALLATTVEGPSFTFAKNEAYLRLLRLELALHEYRARHGRYPARLADLAPAVLSSVPNDPFTEQPFDYRATGPSYLLYSLGPDRRDNGGTPIPFLQLNAQATGDLVAGKLYQRRPKTP
jgi:hypothetical protein